MVSAFLGDMGGEWFSLSEPPYKSTTKAMGFYSMNILNLFMIMLLLSRY